MERRLTIPALFNAVLYLRERHSRRSAWNSLEINQFA
jgi:hypothetical protein